MLCAIYKSTRKEGMYLYIEKRDHFDVVPAALFDIFGQPQLVMLFNLAGHKQINGSKNQEILQHIRERGYYLQLPPPTENLHKWFVAEQRKNQATAVDK